MKHLIITLLIAFSSTSAFAQTDCSFLTGNIFVCYFDGTTGLEIFENLDDSQILKTETASDNSIKTEISAPVLIGYDLDIKNCISEAYENEATATCFLNDSVDGSGFSTAREVSQKLSTARSIPSKYSTARPTPQKRVIKRIDAR